MVRLMVNYPISFVSKLPSKLLLAAFFLCLGACAGVTQKPYADVFAFIQKLQTMHPLTIEKLQNEDFVVTSEKNIRQMHVFSGNGPELKNGARLEKFNFRVSMENSNRTFLDVDITNICITNEDLKKIYPSHKASIVGEIYPFVSETYWVKEKDTILMFDFTMADAPCMESFVIDTDPDILTEEKEEPETPANLFDFIEKIRAMHPIDRKKLEKIGFVVTSYDDYTIKRFLGSVPKLRDGTQFEGFDFSASSKDPSNTHLTIGIEKTTVTYNDFKKMYPSHYTFTPYPFLPAFLYHRVQDKEASIDFIFSQEKPEYMWGLIIKTPSD